MVAKGGFDQSDMDTEDKQKPLFESAVDAIWAELQVRARDPHRRSNAIVYQGIDEEARQKQRKAKQRSGNSLAAFSKKSTKSDPKQTKVWGFLRDQFHILLHLLV